MQVEPKHIGTLHIAHLNLGEWSFSMIVALLNWSLLAIKLFQIDERTLTLLGNYKYAGCYGMVLRSGSSTLTDINWINMVDKPY